MSELHRNAAIQWLRDYVSQIEAIKDFIGDRSYLSHGEKAEIQRLKRILKDSLKKDSTRLNLVRNEGSLNVYEKTCVRSAIEQAATQFGSRWNSDPIQSNWSAELAAAKIDITYYLKQLEGDDCPSSASG